jgi:hypothetical protein
MKINLDFLMKIDYAITINNKEYPNVYGIC